MGGFDTIWRFLKRHKRKYIFAGSFVTGAYLTWKYAAAWLSDYKDRQMAAAFVAAKRQTHFESNQRTGNSTVYSMMSVLREALMEELNCETLTEQLQHKPTNKVYIWSELKILSFTRSVVAIYSTSILILTLRVQLNIIGGYIYARNERMRDSLLTEEESAVQQRYLESIQFFLSTGLRNLCNLVRHSVERELMNVSLKKTFTSSSLLEMINRVRESVEQKSEALNRTPFLDFIATTLSSEPQAGQEAINLAQLINDTNGILKSEDYHVVLQTTIDSGFEKLFVHLNKACSAILSDSPTAMRGRCTFDNPTENNNIALAKIIPPLVGTIHITCSDTMTDYLQQLLTLQCIDEFAYQIYESFCQSQHPSS